MQIFTYINPYESLVEARISKGEFNRRQDSFHKRMSDIKQSISSLNEEQHDILAEICNMRHTIHASGKSLYLTESPLFTKAFTWLESINNRLKELKLPKIQFTNKLDSYPSDQDVIYGVADNEDDNLKLFYEYHNQLNNDIESYLLKIDKDYKTNYCPTGAFRYD